jgi:hypothetical protein
MAAFERDREQAENCAALAGSETVDQNNGNMALLGIETGDARSSAAGGKGRSNRIVVTNCERQLA